VSGEPAEEPCELRATPAVRRALSQSPPEAVAAAAREFITGPLLPDPHQIGEAAAASGGRQVLCAS